MSPEVGTAVTPSNTQESLLSVVLLGTGEAACIAESLTSVLEFCIGIEQSDITLVLHGAASADEHLFRGLGTKINIVTTQHGASIGDAWTLGLEQTPSQWSLLMSDDIRLSSGWLSPIFGYLGEHIDTPAITPTIGVGPGRRTTDTPDSSFHVCLMLSRKALAEGRISKAEHVEEAFVTSVAAAGPTPGDMAGDTIHSELAVSSGADAASLRSQSTNSLLRIESHSYLEQLPADQAQAVLIDCNRALKPGATIHVQTIDAYALVVDYLANQPNGAAACRELNQAFWGHGHLYDEASLTAALNNANFTDVIRIPNARALIVEATKAN